jgi:hypothetical protein
MAWLERAQVQYRHKVMTIRPKSALSVLAVAMLAACATPRSYQGVTGSPSVEVTAGGTPTPSPGGTCQGVSLDIAPGVKGEATQRQALMAFLKSGSLSLVLPKTGWRGPDAAGRFTSGAASVTVFRIPGAGFAVTDASSC